jgi:hypothetical protein
LVACDSATGEDVVENWTKSVELWHVNPPMGWTSMRYMAKARHATVIIDRGADAGCGDERFWAFWLGQFAGTYPTEKAARRRLGETYNGPDWPG